MRDPREIINAVVDEWLATLWKVRPDDENGEGGWEAHPKDVDVLKLRLENAFLRAPES